jgi:hypothetical protein
MWPLNTYAEQHRGRRRVLGRADANDHYARGDRVLERHGVYATEAGDKCGQILGAANSRLS